MNNDIYKMLSELVTETNELFGKAMRDKLSAKEAGVKQDFATRKVARRIEDYIEMLGDNEEAK